MSDETISIPWKKLFRLASTGVATYYSGPIGGAAVGILLDELLGIQADEIKLLNSIDNNVKALLHGPYNVGMVHLSDARKPYRNDADKQKCIENARLSFVQAYGQEKEAEGAVRVTVIQYHIATCWLMNGYMDDARDWFVQSYTTALECLQQWQLKANIGIIKAQVIPTMIGGVASEVMGVVVGLIGGGVFRAIHEKEILRNGRVLYDMVTSFMLLEGNPSLRFVYPPLPPALFDGYFNVKSFTESQHVG